MSENPETGKVTTQQGESNNTSNGHNHNSHTEAKESTKKNNGHSVSSNVRKQKPGTPVHAPWPHTYQTGRSPKKSTVLYIVIVGACALLVGGGALYVSLLAKTPWTPVPENMGSFEATPVSQPVPPVVEQQEPIAESSTAITPKENPQPIISPNAVIDVPGVGLRNAPDITGKTISNSLKLGERVEIVKKVSGKGPSWVRIKTRTGKMGWVFASVVKELKHG